MLFTILKTAKANKQNSRIRSDNTTIVHAREALKQAVTGIVVGVKCLMRQYENKWLPE